MGTKHEVRKAVDDALFDLEQLADEIRVKLHLAEMDTRDVWQQTFEPRLFAAREHAKEASLASKAAIEETVKAIREFAETI